jgi:hypothetical protein
LAKDRDITFKALDRLFCMKRAWRGNDDAVQIEFQEFFESANLLGSRGKLDRFHCIRSHRIRNGDNFTQPSRGDRLHAIAANPSSAKKTEARFQQWANRTFDFK